MDSTRQDQSDSGQSTKSKASQQPTRPALKRGATDQSSLAASQHGIGETGQTAKKGRRGTSFLNLLSVKEPSRDAWAQYAEQQKKEASIKGKAVVVGGVSSRKLPAHVPKVNSKWDGLPHATSHSSKDGSVRSKKSEDSSRSASTATSARHRLNKTTASPHPLASSASSQTTPAVSPAVEKSDELQQTLFGRSLSPVTVTSLDSRGPRESDNSCSDPEEDLRVMSRMLSSLEVPLPLTNHSDGADESQPTSDISSQSHNTSKSQHQSYIPRPVHAKDTLGEISAWPMPPRTGKKPVNSSLSASPPPIARKAFAFRPTAPHPTGTSRAFAGAEAPNVPHKYTFSTEHLPPLPAFPMPPRSNRSSIDSASTEFDASPPPILRRAGPNKNEQPFKITGKAPTWGTPRNQLSPGPAKTNVVVAAVPQARSVPESRPGGTSDLERDKSTSVDMPRAAARPVTPTNTPRSYSVPRGLTASVKSSSPARNFARPFSPDNPPPATRSGSNSPSSTSPKPRRRGRSPGRLTIPRSMAVHALTDNSLPTIPESDAGSIRSMYLHKGADDTGDG